MLETVIIRKSSIKGRAEKKNWVRQSLSDLLKALRLLRRNGLVPKNVFSVITF